MDTSSIMNELDEKGWIILENIIDRSLVSKMRDDIDDAYQVCREIQIRNGIADKTEYTVHHLPVVRNSFIDFLDDLPIHDLLKHYFDGNFILNSLGGAINTRTSASYAHNIHRDVRTYSKDFPLLINTLVMLDDFTSDNGATYLLSGSHKSIEKPTESEFFATAEQAIAPAGSLLIFNSNVWHAAGESSSDLPRRSITPMFSRPFIKQQFDYPRALGEEFGRATNEKLRQIIGFNSRVPSTLDEWYQPPEKRMYRPGQG